MSDSPLLTIEGLKTHFHTDQGVARAVDDVSLSVMERETLGIVGESGCGKSVTALSIMRLLAEPAGRIVAGRIKFAGHQDLVTASEAEMRAIRGNEMSMIFQEPMSSLNPIFSAGSQIAEVLLEHQKITRRETQERVVEMLRMVGVASPELRARNYPHQMSGGMRQRVMIAMALACRPKLMLADEPTTALDVTIQAQILDLMNKLKQDVGTAIILITHNMGVVAEMAQRVCVMYAGVIVEEADVKTIFARPLHPYTVGLLESLPGRGGLPRKRSRLKAIPGIVPNLLELGTGCRFASRCEHVHEPCRIAEPPLAPPDGATSAAHRTRCWLHVAPDRQLDRASALSAN